MMACRPATSGPGNRRKVVLEKLWNTEIVLLALRDNPEQYKL